MNCITARRGWINRLAGVAILVLVIASEALAQGQGLLDRGGSSVLAENGIAIAWQVRLPTGYGRQIRDALVGQNNLYFITDDGVIYCLDRQTAVLRWVYPTCKDYEMISGWAEQSVLENKQTAKHLYITMVSRVLVLEASTGKLIRRLELPGGAGGAACGDGRNVYVGSANGRLYGIQINTGSVLWHINSPGPILSSIRYSAGQLYYLAGSYLCVAGAEQPLLAARMTASRKLPAAIAARLSIGNKLIYVSYNFGHTGQLAAMRKGLALPEWQIPLLGSVSGPAVQIGARTYQEMGGLGVLCVDPAKGLKVWNCSEGRQFLSVVPSAVLLLGQECLLVADQANGSVKAKVKLNGTIQAPNDPWGQQAILLDSSTGQVVCLQGAAK